MRRQGLDGDHLLWVKEKLADAFCKLGTTLQYLHRPLEAEPLLEKAALMICREVGACVRAHTYTYTCLEVLKLAACSQLNCLLSLQFLVVTTT
jgi:hypothetical protein